MPKTEICSLKIKTINDFDKTYKRNKKNEYQWIQN